MSRISVEWIDEHRREVVTGSAIIIIFFLAVFWWYIFSTASTGPLQMSAISGVVFIDDDVDGVFSPDDEFGFPAVAIQLYDSSGLLTSEVTDDEGTFIFSGLDPGEYTVREILPNDWEATSERELDVNVAQGETLFLSFGLAEIEEGPIPVVLTYGTLSGTVYDDDNNNGEFDELEIGVENVQVKLSNSLGDVAEILTDSEGKYLFENLRTGEYRLNEVVPQGWYNTTDSNVKVVVTSEQETVTDFGIGKVTEGDGDDEETGPSSTITVQVFRDNNENKVHDSSEGGILGVAISLMEGEELVDKQSTNSKGRVFFEVTKAGTYTVMEEDLPSYTSTTPNEVEVEVVLETDYEVFFGDFRRGGPPPPPPPSTSTIVGTVFYDADYDGSVDPGEDGIPGVTVSLERGGSPYRSDVTDSNGQVSFSSLSDGSYQLIETDPEGYFSTTSNTLSFSVTSGTYTGIFGDAEYASLYGYAFDDADGDGIFDEVEDGLYGVTVSLYDDGGLVASVTTDEDGLYSFTELMPGIYEVSSDPVEGYFRTTPGSVQVELGPGDEKRVDFGYSPDDSEFGSVFGTVYNDKDGSTDRSLGELGLEDVEITLTLVDDGSESTTTDEFGVYTFKITSEGSYNIHEENPTEWISTTPDDIPVSAVFSSDNGSPHDFGDTLGATVSGMVYEDADEDEVKDAEEEGVPDVTVKLLQKEVEVESTTTKEDGTYSFQVLASGKYTVKETDLDDWYSTTDNEVPITIGELVGQTETVDFGDYHGPWGTIWGIVWDDSDGDGLIGEEDGIEGILVSLYDDTGLFASTTTDTDGEYWFEDLVPGIYDVETVEIDDYIRTTPGLVKPNVGSGDTKQVNFGFVSLTEEIGTLYGTVYNDKDGDTERDFSELGLSGVTINLYPAESPEPSQTTTTNEYGYYTFKISGPTTYLIRELDPTDWVSTTPNDIIQSCSLGSENESPHDYGDTLGATVSGMVYDDFNRDEVKDGDETGVEGVTVKLFLDEEFVKETTTDSDGLYSLLIIESGDYEVRETDLEGWESSTDNELPFTVGELIGQEIVDKDFGDYELGKGKVTGTVFDDDGDGIQETGEDGLANVKIEIYDIQSQLVDDAETDVNGDYEIDLLIPGTYKVKETNPPGWTSTTPDEVIIDLEEAEEETVDFGDQYEGTLSVIYGTVWDDDNNNQVQDFELGIPDVTVTLYEVPAEGPDEQVATKTTNVYGSFSFGDLENGKYRVVETNLAGWESTTPDDVLVIVSSPNGYDVDFGDLYPNPSISIVKKVIDPLTELPEDSVHVASGTEVDYEFTLENTGNVPLTQIEVEDDVLTTITLDETELDPGETTSGSTSHVVTEDTDNTATVTAIFVTEDEQDDDVEVDDEDTASVTIGVLEITVTKEVSTDGSTWSEDPVEVYIDYTVYYRFTVKNTGTLPLTDVTLDDVMNSDPPQSITLLDTELEPDESTTNAGPVTVTAIEGQNTNTATAKGWYLTFDTTNTDSTSYTATPEPGKIHGTVFHDENENKVQDGVDYGISGTTIKLWQETTLVDTLTTDSSGEYEFNDVIPGDYKVEEVDIIPEAIDTTPDEVDVTIDPGKDEEVNFGNNADKGRIYGTVFIDHDANGLQDGGEDGISNVVIEIYDGTIEPSETPVETTKTDSSGDYSFSMFPGTYTVQEVNPSWVVDDSTPNSETVTIDIYDIEEVNFGDVINGVVKIQVFEDLNRDGYMDYDEDGLEDVIITVYYPDGTEEDHNTDSNGVLYLDLLPGESYDFKETNPTNYYSTTTDRHDNIYVESTWLTGPLYFGDAQNTDLEIRKQVIDGNGDPQDWYAHVIAGEIFKFKFTLTNHGSEDITGLDYEDLSINPSSLPSTVSPGTTTVEVDSDFPAYAGDDYEIVKVWKPGYGCIASDDTDWFGEDAEIWVYVEVQDADSTYMQSGAQVRAGGDAKYHFVVENRGNVDLTNVVIVDSVLGSVFSPFSLSEGGRRDDLYDTQPAVLDSGGRSVTAYGDTPIQTVDHSAVASYTGKKVELEISKEVSTDGSIWDPNHVTVVPGETVHYKITVKNTGDEILSDITLSDPDIWTSDKTYTSLAPGAKIEELEQVTAEEDTVNNIADVSAWWYSIELTGNDQASYTGSTDPASIHGMVFFDNDKDGEIDPVDYGIEETTIKLWQGTTLVDSTKTDKNGEYEFTGLDPGAYKVEEIDRITGPGAGSTTPNEEDVTLIPGEDREVNFGDYADTGDITGYVFFDKNDNQIWDIGERDVSGVTLQLKQGATVVESTDTDKYGYYKFNIAPGTYDVFVVKPGNYDSVSTTNPVEVIVTPYSYDYVEFGLTDDAGIDLKVYNDKDRDGQRDFGEDGINNVEIEVYDDNGYLKSYSTRMNGWVYIDDLSPGTYAFVELDPSGYFSTTTNAYTRTLPAGNYYQDLYYGDAKWETDLRVDKKILKTGGGWDDHRVLVEAGRPVSYKFILENTGDTTIYSIRLNDEDLGDIIIPDSLGSGETKEYVYTTSSGAESGYHSTTVWAYIGSGVSPVDSDSACYIGKEISISIDKQIKIPGSSGYTDNRITFMTGDTVEYKITVKNTGELPISGIEVTDEYDGALPVLVPFTTSLNPGASSSETYTRTAEPGLHNNYAYVTGDTDFRSVSDSDIMTYIAGKPELSVLKQVSTDGTTWSNDNVNVLVDSTVHYKFTVTNIGDVEVENIELTDTHFGTIVDSLTLGVGASETYTRQVDDALPDNQDNTVTATGEWVGLPVGPVEDDASYFGVDRDIIFRKQIKGPTGGWEDVQVTVRTGDTVSYRFIIENNGNVDLKEVEINDPDIGTSITVGTVSKNGGYYESDPIDDTAVTGTHENEAIMTGSDTIGEVELKDKAKYIAGNPLISVTKQVSADGSDYNPDYVEVFVGDIVYYKFTVTNIGDVELSEVEVHDTHFPTIVDSLTLDIGESKEYLRQIDDALPDQQDNTVTVDGHWEGIPAPQAQDEAYYIGEEPKLTIKKEVKGYDGVWKDDKTYAKTGDVVTFKITIENTGNVDLSNLELTDDFLPSPITIPSLTTTPPDNEYVKQYTVPADVDGEFTNTAIVTTTYKSKEISEEDSATYEAGTLAITVDKQVSLVGDYDDDNVWYDDIEAYVGDTVYYRFIVTNTGLVQLTDITLTDPDMNPSTIVLKVNSLVKDAITSNADPVYTTAIADEQYNTATVSGEWQGIPATEAEDTAYYFGMIPQITVEKKVWGPITNDWYDTTVAIPLDEHPKFQYTITNTGNVDLTNVEVKDDVLYDILTTDLLKGESMTVEVQDDDLAVAGLHTNTVTVTADQPIGQVTDQATYYGGTPGMEIIKLIKGPDGLWHDDPVILDENDDVYYMYTVTNTGTTPIEGLVVIDDRLGRITMSKVDLGIGESAEGTDQSTAVGGTITNTATATATSYDVPLEDEDTATYTVFTEAYIAGTVFEDLNLNGVFDVGESGKSGVIIDLSGPSSGSDTSGPDGTYSFTVTQAGTYTVTAPDISGWQIQTDDEVDVTVNANELDGREFTVNFGYAEESCEYRDYYLAYEDACDNTFEDFGMIFEVNEVYLYDHLQEVQMVFTSRIYDSDYDHLIHIKRNLNGASTVKIERTVPVYGDEAPAGTNNLNGDVDVILYDTEKYSKPSKQMNEEVKVTITVEDPLANPKTQGTPPRQFQNEAAEHFYDLEPFWANYDPYEESNHPTFLDWHINERIYTGQFGYPGIYVPRILAIPETDWIPPYTGTCIVQPYGSFDDYYRYGILEDWWHSSMVTNNAVEYGGLSWGPYSLP